VFGVRCSVALPCGVIMERWMGGWVGCWVFVGILGDKLGSMPWAIIRWL